MIKSFFKDIDREIQEKHAKIEYVQQCANYLLSKTVDARGLTINMNELTKFCQQLRNLTKRIKKLKKSLINSNDVRGIRSIKVNSKVHKLELAFLLFRSQS
jgi:hypothetical protein